MMVALYRRVRLDLSSDAVPALFFTWSTSFFFLPRGCCKASSQPGNPIEIWSQLVEVQPILLRGGA
jgi:hypothetical protein